MTPLSRLLERNITKTGNVSLPASTAIIDKMDSIVDGMERFAHRSWEDAARRSGVLSIDNDDVEFGRLSPTSRYRNAPEIDLSMPVPCEVDMARMYLLEGRTTTTDGDSLTADDRCSDESPPPLVKSSSAPDDVCSLRDVITRDILVEYAKVFHDDEFDLATHPIVLRNLWPAESFHDFADVVDVKSGSGNNDDRDRFRRRGHRRLTPNAILNDPQLSNLTLPSYFSDAANKTGYAALVPDAADGAPTTLSQFLRKILSGDSPNAKIGTQVIIDEHPELRDEIMPPSLAKELFGWNTYLEDAKLWLKYRLSAGGIGTWMGKLVPPMTTFPVFIAGNRHRSAGIDETRHPRTDLHAEPIGNIASQLHGTRRWTLVPTMWSGLLRPTISRHRGYFYSNMDPLIELRQRLNRIPLVYECVTRRGDSVWIPPWMWHRVDYDDDGDGEISASEDRLSIGASIFHFYPTLYITNFPLFSFLIVPNLIREILGFNVE
ncbi:hypothetical protein ACHAW5_007920 [Stephanodiscus triporus]|uniref:JmjC domain-containing protein n=1 Tax=Stephanodiscus triporus TaxID=2934178 RepID=A0ABD3N1T9_9STRA